MSNLNQVSSSEEKLNEDPGFFYRPNTIQWILRVFYGLCALLVLVEFIIHRHIEISIEKLLAFYPIYGFVACVILVLIANQMRKILIRDEDYYANSEEETKKCVVGKNDHE